MTEYVEMKVTCHTQECFNKDITLAVLCALPNCVVFCGVCNEQIMDKVATDETPSTD